MKKTLLLALAVLFLFGCSPASNPSATPSTGASDPVPPTFSETATPQPSASDSTPTATSQPSASATGADADTIVFTDSCGREVTLPKKIERVAPSGSTAQMLLFSLAPDTLIGWSSNPSESTKKYFPEKYWNLPEFGQFYGKSVTLNMEALIAADPQVIIDIGNLKPTHKEDMDAIQKQTGIPTIFVEATLESFPKVYRELGELLGVSEKGNEIASYIEGALAIPKEIPEADRVSVFFGNGESGLDANAKGSIHADVIPFVGAENAAVVEEVSNRGGGNTINMEQLLQFDPDVILVTSTGGMYDKIATDPTWKDLRAVKEGKFYEIPSDPYGWLADPPSVNRVIGISWLSELLYPDLYDIDMVAETQKFYKLFWHYDLTEAEARELLANSIFKK